MSERSASALEAAQRLRERGLEEATRDLARATDLTEVTRAGLMHLDAQVVAVSAEERELLTSGGPMNAAAMRDRQIYRQWLAIQRRGVQARVEQALRSEGEARTALANSKRECDSLERLSDRRSDAIQKDHDRRVRAELDDQGALRQALQQKPK
jgi:flagellar export protein FliJ